MKTHFNVVVPLYNADEWVLRNLKTLKAQNYDNFSVVYVNDASSDNSKQIIEEQIKDLENFHLINKEKNGGALNSLYTGIEFLDPAEEDVTVVLDGDDWFARPDVLKILNKAYFFDYLFSSLIYVFVKVQLMKPY